MNYGIDVEQYRALIVRPALERIQLWSPPAEVIVLGSALVESELKYVKQLNGGPACGPHQMEPATHDDIYGSFLIYHPVIRQRVVCLSSSWFLKPDAREMIGNWMYAAAMCRVYYRRISAALPRADDVLGMACYWKRYYNTRLGAGTVDKAIPHFEIAYASLARS